MHSVTHTHKHIGYAFLSLSPTRALPLSFLLSGHETLGRKFEFYLQLPSLYCLSVPVVGAARARLCASCTCVCVNVLVCVCLCVHETDEVASVEYYC